MKPQIITEFTAPIVLVLVVCQYGYVGGMVTSKGDEPKTQIVYNTVRNVYDVDAPLRERSLAELMDMEMRAQETPRRGTTRSQNFVSDKARQLIDPRADELKADFQDPEAKVSFLEVRSYLDFTNSAVDLIDVVEAESESALSGLSLSEGSDWAEQFITEDEDPLSGDRRPVVSIAMTNATAINKICSLAKIDLSLRVAILGVDEASSGLIEKVIKADIRGKAVALAQAVAEAVAQIVTDDKFLFSKAKVDALATDIKDSVVEVYLGKNFTADGVGRLTDDDARKGNSTQCAEAVARAIAEAVSARFPLTGGEFVDTRTDVYADSSVVRIVEENEISVEDEIPEDFVRRSRQVFPRRAPPQIAPGVHAPVPVAPPTEPDVFAIVEDIGQSLYASQIQQQLVERETGVVVSVEDKESERKDSVNMQKRVFKNGQPYCSGQKC